jgi:hypothetical protein
VEIIHHYNKNASGTFTFPACSHEQAEFRFDPHEPPISLIASGTRRTPALAPWRARFLISKAKTAFQSTNTKEQPPSTYTHNSKEKPTMLQGLGQRKFAAKDTGRRKVFRFG